MNIKKQKYVTLFGIFGFAFWFFGNLYEAIVFGPNWSIKSPGHLKFLNEFFSNSSPTVYFMPMTLITVIVIWILTFMNKEVSVKKEYKIASILSLIITLFTTFIVTFVLSKMFGPGYYEDPKHGYFYGRI